MASRCFFGNVDSGQDNNSYKQTQIPEEVSTNPWQRELRSQVSVRSGSLSCSPVRFYSSSLPLTTASMVFS